MDLDICYTQIANIAPYNWSICLFRCNEYTRHPFMWQLTHAAFDECAKRKRKQKMVFDRIEDCWRNWYSLCVTCSDAELYCLRDLFADSLSFHLSYAINTFKIHEPLSIERNELNVSIFVYVEWQTNGSEFLFRIYES